MKKISNGTVMTIIKHVLPETDIVKTTPDNIEEFIEILASIISSIVTDIEDKGNGTDENYALLKELDDALDEINETEDIDYDDLNERLKM